MNIHEAVLACCELGERESILRAMRDWAAECQWADCEPGPDTEEFLASLTDRQILDGIERNYDGGITGFLLDWSPVAVEVQELGGVQAPEGGAK